MKRLTTISAAILLAGGIQLAYAQPPGGGGGRGGFGGMDFDALNTDDTPGTANEGEQVLTVDEVGAFFEQMMAGRGGGGPGGGAQQGQAAGGGAPGGGAAGGRGRGGGGFDPTTIFANWDTNEDGEVTQAEFDARPQGGRGRGGGGPGGGRAGGPPQ